MRVAFACVAVGGVLGGSGSYHLFLSPFPPLCAWTAAVFTLVTSGLGVGACGGGAWFCNTQKRRGCSDTLRQKQLPPRPGLIL